MALDEYTLLALKKCPVCCASLTYTPKYFTTCGACIDNNDKILPIPYMDLGPWRGKDGIVTNPSNPRWITGVFEYDLRR